MTSKKVFGKGYQRYTCLYWMILTVVPAMSLTVCG